MKKRDPLRWRNRRRLWSRRSTDVWQVCFLSRKEALLSGASPFLLLSLDPAFPPPPPDSLVAVQIPSTAAASETIVPSTGGYPCLDRCTVSSDFKITFLFSFDPVRGNKLSEGK